MTKLGSTVYQGLLKKTSTWVSLAMIGGFVLELGTETFSQGTWSAMNKGKLWEDVQKERQQRGLSSN
ncbi:ubiquinol-cytochrome-c reductase subunit [Planoprotostelium fungivorum]|uniref:Complex III subunit 9 n=1 Tax=Planoprotostelium fungivorum TaxID=1890364 RepID=A0A2P6N6G9_9EUKA|nr:ubiquinol-cytochrome-c reductase subunit [Planoprotostelium fungivorum]